MVVEKKKDLLVMLVLIAALILGYELLTMRDQRHASDRISDAIDALPSGAEKASQQLESRTPGQKLGDGIKDMGGAIKENTGP